MLTPFGKEVRKLRIDKSVNLKSMAEGIDVSSAFLSAVETGRKPIPTNLADKIINYLDVSNEQAQILRSTALESATTINLNIADQNQATKETVAMFARNFTSLSEEDMERIKKIMGKNNEEK